MTFPLDEIELSTMQFSGLPATKLVAQLQLTGICICDAEWYGYFRAVLKNLQSLSHIKLKL